MKNSEATAKFSGKSVLPPIRGSVFPEIRACMEEQDFHINIIRGKKKVSPVIQRRGNVYQFTFWCKLSPICVTDLNLYCGRNFLSGIYMYALRDTVRSYLIVHAVVICTYLAINVYWPSIRLNYYRLQSSHPPKVASPSRTSSPPPLPPENSETQVQ